MKPLKLKVRLSKPEVKFLQGMRPGKKYPAPRTHRSESGLDRKVAKSLHLKHLLAFPSRQSRVLPARIAKQLNQKRSWPASSPYYASSMQPGRTVTVKLTRPETIVLKAVHELNKSTTNTKRKRFGEYDPQKKKFKPGSEFPVVPVKELSQATGLSEKAIQRNLKSLKALGFLGTTANFSQKRAALKARTLAGPVFPNDLIRRERGLQGKELERVAKKALNSPVEWDLDRIKTGKKSASKAQVKESWVKEDIQNELERKQENALQLRDLNLGEVPRKKVNYRSNPLRKHLIYDKGVVDGVELPADTVERIAKREIRRTHKTETAWVNERHEKELASHFDKDKSLNDFL